MYAGARYGHGWHDAGQQGAIEGKGRESAGRRFKSDVAISSNNESGKPSPVLYGSCTYFSSSCYRRLLFLYTFSILPFFFSLNLGPILDPACLLPTYTRTSPSQARAKIFARAGVGR